MTPIPPDAATKFPEEGIAATAWDDPLAYEETVMAAVGFGIITAFNPPDGDESYEWLLLCAVERAAMFIEAQPCVCPADPDDDPCDRCLALGRDRDEVVDR